jgi:hypothetical protein
MLIYINLGDINKYYVTTWEKELQLFIFRKKIHKLEITFIFLFFYTILNLWNKIKYEGTENFGLKSVKISCWMWRKKKWVFLIIKNWRNWCWLQQKDHSEWLLGASGGVRDCSLWLLCLFGSLDPLLQPILLLTVCEWWVIELFLIIVRKNMWNCSTHKSQVISRVFLDNELRTCLVYFFL